MRPLIAATVAIVLAGVYALSCWIWPMRDCLVCDGNGHHRPKDDKGRKRKVSRTCWWCRGAGKRLRIGRRLWNRVRRQAHAAK